MKRILFYLLPLLLLFNHEAKSQSNSTIYASGYFTYDIDALNIINTIKTVDGVELSVNEKYYVNHIVSGLKNIGVWDKIKALYGFVGGTAAAHRWNWKDMRDADDAFRLSFGSAISHSNLGTQPNGTLNSWADTFIIPEIDILSNNMSLSYYSLTESNTNNSVEIGTVSLSPTNRGIYLQTSRIISSNRRINTRINTVSDVSYNVNTSKGFFLTQRNNSQLSVFSDLNSINAISTITDVGITSYNSIKIFNWITSSEVGLSLPSNRSCQFSHVGESLTAQQITQMSNIITTAQQLRQYF